MKVVDELTNVAAHWITCNIHVLLFPCEVDEGNAHELKGVVSELGDLVLGHLDEPIVNPLARLNRVGVDGEVSPSVTILV